MHFACQEANVHPANIHTRVRKRSYTSRSSSPVFPRPVEGREGYRQRLQEIDNKLISHRFRSLANSHQVDLTSDKMDFLVNRALLADRQKKLPGAPKD
jgi:hypothetical protein